MLDTVFMPSKQKYHIIVLGAGGTGGWLATFLDKVKSSVHGVTLIDGDIVEEKNILRQAFNMSDVGSNKARAIATRHDFNFIPQFVTSSEELREMIIEVSQEATPMILGGLDNNGTRKLVADMLKNYKNEIVWIDGGNAERHGQAIVCGLDGQGKRPKGFLTPQELHEQFNDLGEDERRPDEISCAEQSESAPQNVTANVMSASIIFAIANKLINGEPLIYNEIKFDTAQMTTQSMRAGE